MKQKNGKIALIPAYMPAQPMLDTARALYSRGFSVVIVNDGSPASFDAVFRKAKTFADVVTLRVNGGKGKALKTGLRYIRDHAVSPYTVVTVDADGQRHRRRQRIGSEESAMGAGGKTNHRLSSSGVDLDPGCRAG